MEVKEEENNVEHNNEALTREADQLLRLLTLTSGGRQSVSEGPSPGPGKTEDNIGLMVAGMFRITGTVAVMSSEEKSKQSEKRRYSSDNCGQRNKRRHSSHGVYHHHM